MATAVHCLYCFESLVEHFDGRKPMSGMSLDDIEQSWAKYLQDTTPEVEGSSGDGSAKKRNPALDRLADSSGTSSPATGSSVSLATETTATSAASSSSLPTDPITESPLFVTWNTVSKRTGTTSLRGCIGNFEALELDDGLSSYAVTSAIRDSRFEPISRRELPSLEVAVTLLTDFEDCSGPMDWELGKHGIRISFSERGCRYGATYLPDVAVEQGWTMEETLISLMRKAGWGGKRDKWTDVKLDVVRYQGKKKALQYPEYQAWRQWVDKQKQE